MKRQPKPPLPRFKVKIINILFNNDYTPKKVDLIIKDVITLRMLFKKWLYNIKYKIYSCKVKIYNCRFKEYNEKSK